MAEQKKQQVKQVLEFLSDTFETKQSVEETQQLVVKYEHFLRILAKYYPPQGTHETPSEGICEVIQRALFELEGLPKGQTNEFVEEFSKLLRTEEPSSGGTAARGAAVGVASGAAAVIGANVAVPAAGFTAAGITAGSPAAALMASYGGAVASGSLCATLQSVGAVGLGAAATGGLALGGAAIGVGVFAAYKGYKYFTSGKRSE